MTLHHHHHPPTHRNLIADIFHLLPTRFRQKLKSRFPEPSLTGLHCIVQVTFIQTTSSPPTPKPPQPPTPPSPSPPLSPLLFTFCLKAISISIPSENVLYFVFAVSRSNFAQIQLSWTFFNKQDEGLFRNIRNFQNWEKLCYGNFVRFFFIFLWYILINKIWLREGFKKNVKLGLLAEVRGGRGPNGF